MSPKIVPSLNPDPLPNIWFLVAWAHPRPYRKWHLEQFSCISTAQCCVRQTDQATSVTIVWLEQHSSISVSKKRPTHLQFIDLPAIYQCLFVEKKKMSNNGRVASQPLYLALILQHPFPHKLMGQERMASIVSFIALLTLSCGTTYIAVCKHPAKWALKVLFLYTQSNLK